MLSHKQRLISWNYKCDTPRWSPVPLYYNVTEEHCRDFSSDACRCFLVIFNHKATGQVQLKWFILCECSSQSMPSQEQGKASLLGDGSAPSGGVVNSSLSSIMSVGNTVRECLLRNSWETFVAPRVKIKKKKKLIMLMHRHLNKCT